MPLTTDMITSSLNPLLHGLRVLDLTRLLPGPFCTLYLTQLGAEVIKIEDPGSGDYARSLSPEMFSLINRGKQSLTLDLRKPEGVDAFKRLVADADVVIESFRPEVMDKLGCGYDTLKTINPKLVYAALTGYGQTGPWKQRAGHDMNYCGYAGMLEQSGAADGPPALSGFQVADLAGGALTCVIGILAAVHGAHASGVGCFVDAAMMDGTLALQATTLSTMRMLGQAPQRGHDMLSGGLPNYSVYECSDGKHVAMAALEPKFWHNFCAAVQRPDLARMPLAPGKAGEPLRKALGELFRTRTRDEWDALLADADTCVSGILTPAEALSTEQIKARGMVVDFEGKPAFGLPLRMVGATTLESLSAPPQAGVDSHAILSRAGLDEQQIEALRQAGITR